LLLSKFIIFLADDLLLAKLSELKFLLADAVSFDYRREFVISSFLASSSCTAWSSSSLIVWRSSILLVTKEGSLLWEWWLWSSLYDYFYNSLVSFRELLMFDFFWAFHHDYSIDWFSSSSLLSWEDSDDSLNFLDCLLLPEYTFP
jgi:hypothetical protein